MSFTFTLFWVTFTNCSTYCLCIYPSQNMLWFKLASWYCFFMSQIGPTRAARPKMYEYQSSTKFVLCLFNSQCIFAYIICRRFNAEDISGNRFCTRFKSECLLFESFIFLRALPPSKLGWLVKCSELNFAGNDGDESSCHCPSQLPVKYSVPLELFHAQRRRFLPIPPIQIFIVF